MRGALGRAVAAAIGLGLTVAACGSGSPEPKAIDTPTESSSPSPTPSKSPSATAEPTTPGDVIETGGAGKVDAKTQADAEKFVGEFLQAQNKATGSGDFSTVDTMVAETCSVCKASRQYITHAYSGGGKVDGGVYTQPTINAGGSRDDRIVVTVDATISAYTTTDGSGKVVDEGPAEKQSYQYYVSKVDGRWQVVEGSVIS